MAETIAFYPSPSIAGGVVATEIGEGDIPKYAPIVLGVLIGAYTRRLSYEIRDISPLEVEEHFGNPDNEQSVRTQAERMEFSMERKGSRYIAVHPAGLDDGDSTVLAVAKTTPSRPRRLGIKVKPEEANCFVDDVLFLSRDAYGAVALDASLACYKKDREVVTDAFVRRDGKLSSEANWYEELGLSRIGGVKHPFVIAGTVPPQVRLGGITVKEVMKKIALTYPWMGNWEPNYGKITIYR